MEEAYEAGTSKTGGLAPSRGRLQHRPADVDRQGADPALVRDTEQGVHAEHHWESDTPSYKIRVSLNGDKATIYFECHYIDPKTSTVMAVAGVDHKLQKSTGRG
jgi:hypothetical protein